jgi:hypothetical protein
MALSNNPARYGFFDNGDPIVAPDGWEIIPEGGEIPPEHREAAGEGLWCDPRRCHSTMTPMWACVWGYVRAFARRAGQAQDQK